MTMASGGVPTVGAEVTTADGDTLGTVKDVSGSCFKVDASMRPDYWLGTDCIASSTGGVVRLTLTKDRLSEAKDEGRHEHTTDRLTEAKDAKDEGRHDHRGVHPHDTTLI